MPDIRKWITYSSSLSLLGNFCSFKSSRFWGMTNKEQEREWDSSFFFLLSSFIGQNTTWSKIHFKALRFEFSQVDLAVTRSGQNWNKSTKSETIFLTFQFHQSTTYWWVRLCGSQYHSRRPNDRVICTRFVGMSCPKCTRIDLKIPPKPWLHPETSNI